MNCVSFFNFVKLDRSTTEANAIQLHPDNEQHKLSRLIKKNIVLTFDIRNNFRQLHVMPSYGFHMIDAFYKTNNRFCNSICVLSWQYHGGNCLKISA